MEEKLNLNQKSTALVVIDLQKGIAGRLQSKYVLENAAKLADTFRKKNMLVILVRVFPTEHDRLNVIVDEPLSSGQAPSDFAEFVPEMTPKESDIIITKKQWGAFYGTELELQLRRRKIDTIVLCGIATNIGVESTARSAYEHGFHQVFAEDAMMSFSEQDHQHSISTIFKRIGRVRKTAEIIDAIQK